MSDQDSDKYFYFGCAVIHGIVLLVLVFFTGSDLLKTLSKNNCCNLSLIVGIFFGIAFSFTLARLCFSKQLFLMGEWR